MGKTHERRYYSSSSSDTEIELNIETPRTKSARRETRERRKQLIEKYPIRDFKTDCGAVSIDALRGIVITIMFLKSFTQRMTKLSNPLTNAFGYDWISSTFFFAQGARTTLMVLRLKESMKKMSREDARCAYAENYIRTLFSNFLVFVWALILVITQNSHNRLPMWDVLCAVIMFDTFAYPIAMYLPLWLPLILVPFIMILSPYIFDVLDGKSFYDQYGWFKKDFNIGHMLGSLFFYGPTPVFPNTAIGLWGIFVCSRCLIEPVATNRKRAFYGFVGLVMMYVAIELQQVYFARGPFKLWVAKYIFTKFTSLPFSLSWTLLQMGANTVSFTVLSIMFDNLPHEKVEYAKRHAERMRVYVNDLAESAVYYLRIFFYRVSRWTLSFYFWYGFFVWVPLRIIGAAKYDNDAYYIDQPELSWKIGEEVADVIFVVGGIVYFILFYVVFWIWEKYGHEGRFTIEYTLTKAADFGWWIFGRFFKKKEEDEEERIGRY